MTEKTHSSLAIPARETQDGHALPPRHREWRRAKIAAVLVLLLLAIGALRTVIANIVQNRSVTQMTMQNAKQYVDVVAPTQSDGNGNVTVLPGTLRGYVESPIYARATGYPIQYQWTLLEGVNDGDDEVERVAALLAGKYAVLNFIPFNSVDGAVYAGAQFRRPARERAEAITKALHGRGVLAKLRRSAGQDVEAGCGQLRARAVTASTQELRGL